MSKEKKPILRTTKITVTLVEAAKALGHEDWAYNGDYLDADPFDDVNHCGVSREDALNANLPSKYSGIEKLLPFVVARALEDADRQAVAGALGDARRDALVETFEKIGTVGEYPWDGGFVTLPKGEEPGVQSASLDTPNATMEIVIKNPEHLINEIVNGVGMFAPELNPYEPASDSEIKSYFLKYASDYFDVFGGSKAEVNDRAVDNAYPEDVDVMDALNFHLSEMSVKEVVEELMEVDGLIDGDLSSDEIRKSIKLISSVTSIEYITILRELAATLRKKGDEFKELAGGLMPE